MTLKRGKSKRKRGIILLMVVSLVALFILMGVTYALIANQYLYATKLEKESGRLGDTPETEVDMVLGQIVYDAKNPTSLQYHSLLRDLYGTDAVQGLAASMPTTATFTSAPAAPNGPIIQLTYQPNTSLSSIQNYYAGRVLTFFDGELANLSTRIMANDPTTNSIYLEPFDKGSTQSLPVNWNAIKWPTTTMGVTTGPIVRFLINGAPFNGSGAGYDRYTYGLDATYSGSDGAGGYLAPVPVALLPHYAGYDAGQAPRGGAINLSSPPALPLNTSSNGSVSNVQAGGMDEPWDAADLQNMFLAMVPPRAAENPNIPIIPSFHRPELVAYLTNTGLPPAYSPIDTTNPQHRDFLRTFIFRPMPWDHPNFTGSNSSMTLSSAASNIANVNGVWDVDNDGDGRPDSIWIDPGLPVITTPDGRRYKRLAAILIKDLDGSIDLNAHGNLAQVLHVNYRAEQPLQASFIQYPTGSSYVAPSGNALGMAPSGVYLPRGLGFGPAEVDFLHVLANVTPPAQASTDGVAVQAYSNILHSRYESNLTDSSNNKDAKNGAYPGVPNTRDQFSYIKHHGVPPNYASSGMWYGSPPDVWGRGTVVLDVGGQPIMANAAWNTEMVDSPYELSLSGQTNNGDTPFTVTELERLRRYHDPDAQSIASRPLSFASTALASQPPGQIQPGASGTAGPHARREMFGMCSHLPVPATAIPQEMRADLAAGTITGVQQYAGGVSILDLYRYKLLKNGVSQANVNVEMLKIVPWEFFKGQKLDINRWMGNGFDDNGNNIFDEPAESNAGESAWLAGSAGPISFKNVNAQYFNNINNIGLNTTNATSPLRQFYARQLFCLAMLFLPDTFPTMQCPQETTLSPAVYRRLVIRRIAQWAVNCIDFRDPDAIMTPFEFDYNPWDGWQVDGDLTTDGGLTLGVENPPGITPIPPADRGVVWGMEFPELLITETLAFHDRRVKDTDKDNGSAKKVEDSSMNHDTDLDQFRVPQGSLFVELYCPRANLWTTAGQSASQKPLYPPELYSGGQLQLGKFPPQPGFGGVNRPVWRLAVSPLLNDSAAAGNQSSTKTPLAMLGTNPESASFDPAEVNLLPGAAQSTTPPTPVGPLYPDLDPSDADPQTGFRYVWFTGTGGTNVVAPESNYIYSSPNANPTVQPGGYVVVGPRTKTYLGSTSTIPTPGVWWVGNSPQNIDLNSAAPPGMQVTDLNSGTTPTTIRTPTVVIADQPNPWGNRPTYRCGINVTEPLPQAATYYPAPSWSASPPAGYEDFYDDPNTPTNFYLDTPLDTLPTYPLNLNSMLATRTYSNMSVVYLQRLADPTQGFHPVRNPYLTIDSSMIDVTVFSGEEDTNRQVTSGSGMANIDISDPPVGGGGPRTSVKFRTRQRGVDPTAASAGTGSQTPWTALSYFKNTPSVAAASGNAYFNFSLDFSNYENTLGYLNYSIGTLGSYGPQYVGESQLPLAWLAWHNRPFANPMELLLVPSSSPARLCSESNPSPINAVFPQNAYDKTSPNKENTYRFPFPFLLGFYGSSGNDPSTGTTIQQAPQFYRLLDFVEVPSPYAGAERWYNPQHFGSVPYYSPPFNKLSRFRDPGRININTIFDQDVWDAVVSQFPGMRNTDGFFAKMAYSRKGSAGVSTSGNWYDIDTSLPTRFANPFRPADSADLMPNIPPGAASATNMRKFNPVEATFLRPDPDTLSGGGATAQPLFQINSTNTQIGNWTSTQGQYHDVTRNPYFTYQPLQKIGNILTTQSNCFAVWITIGYFEVDPFAVDAAHPDGFTLGQEVGADSGEITRHRAFYIIDRSVPVGFIPGSRLNTDDCILLRRLIE